MNFPSAWKSTLTVSIQTTLVSIWMPKACLQCAENLKKEVETMKVIMSTDNSEGNIMYQMDASWSNSDRDCQRKRSWSSRHQRNQKSKKSNILILNYWNEVESSKFYVIQTNLNIWYFNFNIFLSFSKVKQLVKP